MTYFWYAYCFAAGFTASAYWDDRELRKWFIVGGILWPVVVAAALFVAAAEWRMKRRIDRIVKELIK